MIYYLIFCIATAIVCITRVQAPVILKYRGSNETYKGPLFWAALFLIDAIAAPIMVLGVFIFPEAYKEAIIELLTDSN